MKASRKDRAQRLQAAERELAGQPGHPAHLALLRRTLNSARRAGAYLRGQASRNTPKLDAALADLAKSCEERLSDTQTQADPAFAIAVKRLNFTLRLLKTREELEKCKSP